MPDLVQRLEPVQGIIVTLYLSLFCAGCAVLFLIGRDHAARLRENWTTYSRELAARRWEWTDPLMVAAPAIAFSSAFAWLAADHFTPGAFAPLAAALILTHVPIITAAIALPYIRSIPLRDAFGGGSRRFLPDLGTGTLLYLAMLALAFPAMIASNLLLKSIGREPALQEIITLLDQQKGIAPRIFFASWTVLIAPIAEELLFRGILLPLLLRRLRPALAVVILSIAFALLHANLAAMLPLFCVSLSLSLAYIATRSLTVTITMHALFNAATTLTLLLIG